MLSIIRYTLICLMLVFVVPSVVHASGYKVVPRVIDRTLAPRDVVTEEITITNDNRYVLTVYPSANAVAKEGGGDLEAFVSPAQSDRSNTITNWLSIKYAGVDIKPGESVTLPLTISIPSDAAPGEYHAFIGFGSGRNRPQAEAQVAAGSAPGVVLRVSVKDTAVSELKLDTFAVERFVLDADNNAVTYVIENPGDVPITPSGEIIFYDARGSEVGSVPVNPEAIMLEPSSSATLTATAPVSGIMGRYKAFMRVEYGTGQMASVYDTTFFYLVPWQQVLAFFGGLVVLGTITFLFLHRRYRRSQRFQADHAVLPVHVYQGVSPALDHDINLK